MKRQGIQPALYMQALLVAGILWVPNAYTQEEKPLEQEKIIIKGNQGLPTTLYIAPWKSVGEPLGSDDLAVDIGKETQPLERDLFQRELELQRQGYSVE